MSIGLRPQKTGQLVATGRDGQTETYQYFCEEDAHLVGAGYESKTKWCFSIVAEQDVFNFDLVVEDSFMRVEMMNRNDCDRYKARGIPEAFIRLSDQLFRIPICSSKRAEPQSGTLGLKSVEEQHSEDAAKVWRRLVASREAYFDDRRQRFVYQAARTLGSTPQS